MARVPYLDPSDLAPENRDLLSRPITLYKAMANSPKALRALDGVAKFIRHGSGLDARLRELAILQVGYLTKSPYEWSHHCKIGQDFGVTPDDIRAVSEETAGRATKLDAPAKLVLRGAREMTLDMTMSDQTYAAIEKELGREHTLDLTMTIAFYNGVVRLLATLQIDVEPEYQPYLKEFPLPAPSSS